MPSDAGARMVALLEHIAAGVDALLAVHEQPCDERPELVRALCDYLGDGGRFTVEMLLSAADVDPHSRLSGAVAAVVDLNMPDRAKATSLGRTLSSTRGIVRVGTKRGAALYQLELGEDEDL